MAKTAKEITGANSICLAGGVALNCVANGKLQNEGIFDHIYIQPAAGDAGGSLGGALAAHHIFFEKDRSIKKPDMMNGTYLGPEFQPIDIQRALKKYNANYTEYKGKNYFQKLQNYLMMGMCNWMVSRQNGIWSTCFGGEKYYC